MRNSNCLSVNNKRTARTSFGMFLFPWLFFLLSCVPENSDELSSQTDASPLFKEANRANVGKFTALLNRSLRVPEVRRFLKQETQGRFDGDYDVLYAAIKDKQIGVGDSKGRSELLTFEQVLFRQSNNGRTEIDVSFLDQIVAEYPLLQISIPETSIHSVETWDELTVTPYVAILDETTYDELTTTHLDGYDPNGNPILVDANNEPSEIYVVVGPSERVIAVDKSTGSAIARSKSCARLLFEDDLYYYYSRPSYEACYFYGDMAGNNTGTGSSSVASACRSYGKEEWLYQINCTNINNYEKWHQGAPELRIRVMSPEFSFSSLIHTGEMEPSKRKDIKNKWWTKEGQLFKWSEQYSGEAVVYYWYEVDGGPQVKEIKLNAGYSKKDGFKVEASTTINIGKRDDSIGEKLVIIDNCPAGSSSEQTYDLFSLMWKVKIK